MSKDDKCPGCGSGRAKRKFRMPGEFECSSFEDEFQGFSESMQCLRNQLARLQAIVDKLPKTADGVPVVPGMRLYPLHPIDLEAHIEDYGTVTVALWDENSGVHLIHGYDSFRVGNCYSTKEAAEAGEDER